MRSKRVTIGPQWLEAQPLLTEFSSEETLKPLSRVVLRGDWINRVDERILTWTDATASSMSDESIRASQCEAPFWKQTCRASLLTLGTKTSQLRWLILAHCILRAM